MYANFNRYNDQGERMNIFCEPEVDGTLSIIFFPCSKKDQFSKKVAWEFCKIWKMGGMVNNATRLSISVMDNKPKKTFLNWCNSVFNKLEVTIDWRKHEVTYVKNKFGNIVVLKDKPYVRPVRKLSYKK